MPVKISVNKMDIVQLKIILAGIANGVPKAMITAINKSISNTQTQVVKLIGQDLNLSAKRIKQDFHQAKASWGNLKGALGASGDPVGLINFGAKQTKKGVTVKVKKASSRSLLKHAYIGKGKPSKKNPDKTHVFWRQYSGPRKPVKPGMNYARMPDKYRSPVERKEGPRIEDIYGTPAMQNKTQKIAADLFIKNLGKATEDLIRRFG